ncbi:MAG: hypothetical protein MUQ25_12515, partial [Candidatus Aminicenantes bacterium]|nr:hypothetical protein [Candidatus Aminicenantes bacterium]
MAKVVLRKFRLLSLKDKRRGAIIPRGQDLPCGLIPWRFELPAFDAAHKDQIGQHEANVTGDRRTRRQLLQKGLLGYFHSASHVLADLCGLVLPGLLGPSFSQFVVLPAQVDREKKKEQGREKDGAPEKEDLLEVLAVLSAG